jgi:serine protease Do
MSVPLKKPLQILALALAAPCVALAASTITLPSFKEVARKVRPSVVNLSIVKNVKVGGGLQAFQRDPYMEQFFGRFFGGQGGDQQDQGQDQGDGQGPATLPEHSLGSGIIIDAEKGYILTNNHVVDGADGITVKLADKRELAGEVVGRDPKTDLAVVKLKKPALDLVAAPFGDSDAIDVGDWVLAVGSPFGLEQTVSHGIISARGRVIGEGPYDDFLQTDAPINPGNSGGPLVNLDGEVIGINSAITTRSGGSEGIGFAIPSNLARKVYRDLASVGHVTRGWLGISIQDVDGPLAKHFGLTPGAKGALVADVMDEGPAKAAGLRAGDVIQEFDGKPVDGVRELQRMVADTLVGRAVPVTLWRDGAEKRLNIKVGNMDKFDAQAQAEAQGQEKSPKLGLQVRALEPEEAQERHLDAGVVVEQVEPNSPAEEGGVQPGDIILEMEKARVTSPKELARLASKLKAGDAAIIRVNREGRSLYLTLSLADR